MKGLYWNTVSPLLASCLKTLMTAEEFAMFRLVGGTSLSLQLGHRISVDIDLFTDADYDSVDFKTIDNYLRKTFNYVYTIHHEIIGMGKPYTIGNSINDCIKLDLFYTDAYIRPCKEVERIKMATIEEIIAMKLEVVSNGGRKKDFWDLHELLDDFSLDDMLELHKERYPYNDDEQTIRRNSIDFTKADNEFDPMCLRGKYWELIKLEITVWAAK